MPQSDIQFEIEALDEANKKEKTLGYWLAPLAFIEVFRF